MVWQDKKGGSENAEQSLKGALIVGALPAGLIRDESPTLLSVLIAKIAVNNINEIYKRCSGLRTEGITFQTTPERREFLKKAEREYEQNPQFRKVIDRFRQQPELINNYDHDQFFKNYFNKSQSVSGNTSLQAQSAEKRVPKRR